MARQTRSIRAAAFSITLCAVALAAVAACGAKPASPVARSDSGASVMRPSSSRPADVAPGPRYMAGDAHTHTWLSPDGRHTESEVASRAFAEFGLDWITATDHGGTSIHTETGDRINPSTWMWRTIRTFAYPAVLEQRARYTDKRILQGIEWHMPAHDHAGVSLSSNAATGLAEFDYRFDSTDKSTAKPGWSKHNRTRADSVYAAKWLASHYPTRSYLIVNHPSRKYNISARDLRDLNNAAPTVAFGFEGIPGRQKLPARGGYEFDFGSNTKYARTYGGADYYAAHVGGVWDSLLGEGRRFFMFADSDFHDPSSDFWPGEYAKSYTWIDGVSYAALIAGLRRGNSFSVTGGIVDQLEFVASSGDASATMGQTLTVRPGSEVTVTVRFRVPTTRTGPGVPQLDHLDLIRGLTHAKARVGSSSYYAKTNASTKVINRWTGSPWTGSGPEGTSFVVAHSFRVRHSSYIRLRGTNLGLSVADQTDADGNPLIDKKNANTASKAWEDCWLYANPIYIRVSD